jgi:hypothetical protein
MAEDIPKLRMAADNPVVSAKWLEREQAIAAREREFGLELSLGKFRVGSVKALNAVPLTRGLEREIVYDTPVRLARGGGVVPRPLRGARWHRGGLAG